MLFERMMRWGLACTVSGLLLGAMARADMEDEDYYGPRSTGAAKAAVWNQEMQEKYAEDENKLLLPGLVADKEVREVEVLIEATGLPAGDTPEFILIDTGSSHGYEALFWSMAKPSDVHKALTFIGIEPGGAINPAALRFWAQGDPVRVYLQTPGGERFPIEETIFDVQAGKALEEEGFVFTGSMTVTLPDTGDTPHYAADVYDPRSILPLYNDPGAVMDIPRQAHQGEVYGRYAVNPDWPFSHGQMLTVVMKPAITDGHARREYRLDVTTTNETGNLLFALRKAGEVDPLLVSAKLTPVLEKVVEGSSERQVPILALDFHADIPVGGLGRLARILALMESFNQVRVAPPKDGQLYYRAFLPAPQWSTPEGRPTQPWELHLDVVEGVVSGRLVLYEPRDADEGDAGPTFDKVTHAIGEPADIPRILIADAVMREVQSRAQLPAVLLVFADPALAYQSLMQYFDATRATHGTVYVFTEVEEQE